MYVEYLALPAMAPETIVAAVAANLMQSRTVQLFHDHVLVKNRELQSQHRGIRMDHIILLKDRKQ